MKRRIKTIGIFMLVIATVCIVNIVGKINGANMNQNSNLYLNNGILIFENKRGDICGQNIVTDRKMTIAKKKTLISVNQYIE